MIPWRTLVAQMDATIDAQLAEPVRFLPWDRGEYDDGAPDTSRPVKETLAVLRFDLDTVVDGGGPLERTGKTFASRTVNEPVRLSVSGAAISAVRLREGDRVRALDPERVGTVDEWFEVKWIGSDASGRLDVHLARLVAL
jgi:hypothetical protein